MLAILPQLIYTGLGIGAIYALCSLGFVLLIRAANVVNFAQGQFSMLGAYIMLVLLVGVGVPYWAAFLLAVILMAGFGVVFAGAVYWPLRHRSQLAVIISTIGASILLPNVVLATYGPSPATVPGLFANPGFMVGPIFVDTQYLSVMVITVAMVVLQYVIFEKTLLGKKLQATSQDKEMASMLGISVAAMVLITFAYSAILGALAGVLVAPILFVSVGMGGTLALKAFAANIIGGYGNIPGAILGGLIIGLAETLGAAYISTPYKDAFGFLILLLVLLVRPRGLFGELIAEKA
ncbi:MAG: branched-chain amino acid ABC transporter permease [Rhodospirillales bacterium]|nr:branched-chain amino acid ABC transporter permease [Rhodospirillales bacterium]